MGRLVLRLALFLVLGAAAALVLWFALHQMLAGSTPDVPFWLVVAAEALFDGLDRFRYWVTAAIVLILVAYGPFLLAYLPPKLLSPGFSFSWWLPGLIRVGTC